MIRKRELWIKKIESAWKTRSIVWLTGVRRVGKTTLVKMFKNALYLNCDLPSVARRLEDPEFFYENVSDDTIIIFDEVHRVKDPSILLKIGADNFPKLKILATGSSTLSATKKFRDSLTGRKRVVFLPPVLWTETKEIFNIKDLDYRLLRGGLPELLLLDEKDNSLYSEWIDSFYARDIQNLFNIRNRKGFIKLFQLLLKQSGGIVNYSKLANLCEISRPTVLSHTSMMEIANAIFFLNPFHGGSRREFTQKSKIYAFDTGFVTFVKGWNNIRAEDRGILWEHLVLDILRVNFDNKNIFYWRDKSGKEIDFILKENDNMVHTIECKISSDTLKTKSLKKFRSIYPKGKNFVLSPNIKEQYKLKKNGIILNFISTKDIANLI